MSKKARKVLAAILSAMLLIVLSASMLPAHALSNICSTTTGISLTGGNATAICSVDGYQKSVTKCSIKANLQQYKNGAWVTIATWDASFNTYYGALTGTKAVTKGYDYRTQAIYTATSAAGNETYTAYSGVKTY